MEFRYRFIVLVGLVVLVVLSFIRKKKIDGYLGGKKIASNMLLENNSYFKRKVLRYRILSGSLIVMCAFAIICAFIMISRPYKIKLENKNEYNRDIILCLDVSTSVDELNLNLVRELQDTVKKLKGERFGIVIFNTSPVMLTPLTDDYEYVIDVLSQIEKSLKLFDFCDDDYSDNWLYSQNYISDGTLVGNEDRGSSLIGDGLASSVYNFQDLDKDRTRIVIFSTDNDLQGTPYVTLSEAADICKQNNVVVYGIGTNEMDDDDMNEMKSAVNKTKGKFYIQQQSGTMSDIVSNINKEGKNLVKGGKEVITVEMVTVPFLLFLFFTSAMIILTKITRR